MSRRGISLVELVLALGLSSMLATVFLTLLFLGRDAYLDSLDEAGLSRVTYLVPRDLTDGLEQSRLALIAYSPDLLTFASAHDESGRFVTDSRGVPDWQSPISYWLEGGKCWKGRRPARQLVDPSIVGLRSESPAPNLIRVTLKVDFVGYRRSFRGEVEVWARPTN